MSEELTARQLKRLLEVRDKQFKDLRSAYLAELRMLRGQLFGVRARGKHSIAIPFEVEPKLTASAEPSGDRCTDASAVERDSR